MNCITTEMTQCVVEQVSQYFGRQQMELSIDVVLSNNNPVIKWLWQQRLETENPAGGRTFQKYVISIYPKYAFRALL